MVVVATGYKGAVATFDLDPEFPVDEELVRSGVRTQPGPAASLRRQVAKSQGDASGKAQVRRWTFNWANATKDTRDKLKLLYQEARGSGGLVLYYPPDETGASNLSPSPEDFTVPQWKLGTDDTSIASDATALPAGVGGSAYLLSNGGSATDEGYLSAQAGTYPNSGTIFAYSVYIQRPSSNPSAWFTIRFREPDTANTEFATYQWNGSAWAFSVGSGDITQTTATSGSWTRVFILGIAGSTNVSSFPARRYVELGTGTSANPEAGLGVLISGSMLEQAKAVSNITSLAAFTNQRRHVLARFQAEGPQITRWGPRNYSMSVSLTEVPSAP